MATHTKAFMERVEIGNVKAEPVARVCEKFFKQPLDKSPLSSDIDDKVDYVLRETGETVQIHCRETGDEFIYEQYKFRKNSPGSKQHFRREMGRDALCKAAYMVMVPAHERTFHAARMSLLKKKAENAEKAWLAHEKRVDPDPEMPIYSDRWIAKYEYLCRGEKSQSMFLFKDESSGVSIYFKIDQGQDGKKYSKLLFFIPTNFKGVATRPYKTQPPQGRA